MDTNEQKMPTISDLWDKLLQPSPTMGTRGRFHKCERDWYGMDDEQRLWVYHHLQKLRANGEINPNPCFALNNAMQQYELEQFKLKQAKKREPENLNMTAKYETMVRKVPLVSAEYNGGFGIYTLAEAEQFGMEIKYGMNFDWDAYRAKKAAN